MPKRFSTARRLVKLSFLIALPVLLLPALLPRKVSARKPFGASARSKLRPSPAAREIRIQQVVDGLRARLSISDMVVTVERSQNGSGAFSLVMEAGFLETLNDGELEAVIAHELGHVWIFTHHPYLHTEELANEIAMRVVSRETLAGVYEKVWKRAGPTNGDLVYLPSLTAQPEKPEELSGDHPRSNPVSPLLKDGIRKN